MGCFISEPGTTPNALLKEFADFVGKCGEVERQNLLGRIKRAKFIAYHFSGDKLVSVGGVKVTNQKHLAASFTKASISDFCESYRYELGWLCTEEKFRRKGFASEIVEKLIDNMPSTNLFAISREENGKVHQLLKNFEFEQKGIPYTSSRGSYKLIIFLRETT